MMKAFPMIQNRDLMAYIADNSAAGIHKGGYNGVASIIPKALGNNLFVPRYCGLNYEMISLKGLPDYPHAKAPFEPRFEPMHIEFANDNSVVLVQPETRYAHVSARITFAVSEPHYLHQKIELTFHKRFCGEDEKNEFRSLFASYMHAPDNLHVYLKTDLNSEPLADWIGITKRGHAGDTLVHHLPSGRELTSEELAEFSQSAQTESYADVARLTAMATPVSVYPKCLIDPLRFYFGICPGNLVFIMMFKEPERFRFIYSPCGGGKQPQWNPAWDYLLFLEDSEIGVPYEWNLCVAVTPFKGRKAILEEITKYQIP